MSQGQASIQGASIQATITPAEVTPLTTPRRLNLPINFANVANLQELNGNYTPANDTKTIKTFSSSDQANFILLVVDQPTVVTLNTGASNEPLKQVCVQRFLYIGLSTLSGGLASLVLDGTNSGTPPELPMVQGVQVNWTLFYGTASIS